MKKFLFGLLIALLCMSCGNAEQTAALSEPAAATPATAATTATVEVTAAATALPETTATAAPMPTATPSCTPTKARLTAYDEGLNDGHTPDLAVDGEYADVESRWSADGDGRWLILDIGGVGTVTELATAWYKADERTAFFDVETSIDGEDWTTVIEGAESQGDLELNGVDLGEVEARYVRIVGHGNSSSLWNSVLEAEVTTCGDVVAGAVANVLPTATPLPTPSQRHPQHPEAT